MKIILFGFILHFVFLISVFDIYFKSPIINNIIVQKNFVPPPAARMVLFVADGLRANTLFNENENLSPHLKSIIKTKGSWGVAHSRVPTESRPGHIAIIAGFYEDPSAVFTGWKDNLVEFDSLFNRSFVTYSWGSPDILPMFRKGAVKNKVHTFCYDAEDEDFSGQSTKLNTWVFDRVEAFIKSASDNKTLRQTLNSQGLVFFLHLLGTDVAGHANKPHSRQYKDNINVIDEGVKRIENLLDEFYNHDNKTAYIYTSDHGMTDWGSHGAGSPSETEVPLVAWGAGVSGPQLATPGTPSHPQWGVQRDVAQADITPLMAVLVGLPIPVHSVGVVPLEYLSIPERGKAEAVLLNALQLSAQLGRKRQTVEAAMVGWLYWPYPQLTREREEQLKRNITQLISDGYYLEAIEESKQLIGLTHSGLDYYHTYFQGLLLTCVSLSFLAWTAWLLCFLMRPTAGVRHKDSQLGVKTSHPHPRTLGDMVFLLSLGATIYLIYVQSLPLQFHVYCCLPQFLWWNVLQQWRRITALPRRPSLRWPRTLLTAALYLVLLELLVLTFFHRWVLSVVVALVAFWPLTLGERRGQIPFGVQLCWLFSFLLLAVFPCLPVVGRQMQIEFVIVCGALWVCVGAGSLLFTPQSPQGRVGTTCAQMALVAAATAVVYLTSLHYEGGLGLRVTNQVAAWLLLVSSPAMPLLTSTQLPARCLSIALALCVPFLLLCVGHEAFFLLALSFSLCLWLRVEASLSQLEVEKIHFEELAVVDHDLSSDDFRRCFFFLMYVILSFFGTGNIASINSFDVSWVRCFLTVFSPFAMMALILLKTLVPFLLVTCVFRAVNVLSQVIAEKMFVIVLIYCDIMGLHFLFAVKNKGSWLEIGTSVSHFVIMEVTVLFLVTLYYIARLYTGTTLVRESATMQPIAPIWIPKKKHPD